jgi:hypothetical protein
MAQSVSESNSMKKHRFSNRTILAVAFGSLVALNVSGLDTIGLAGRSPLAGRTRLSAELSPSAFATPTPAPTPGPPSQITFDPGCSLSSARHQGDDYRHSQRREWQDN